MSTGPHRYYQGWSRLLHSPFAKPEAGFRFTQPGDIDHPHIPPRIGPELLSDKGPADSQTANQTVLVSAHGFAATPFENYFLLEWLKAQSAEYISSRVMLGCHGESAAAFRQGTWQDWQAPLEAELRKLQQLGYQKQVVITTSTGATLLLELLSRCHFPAIQKLVLVAPLVEPYERLMRLAGLAKKSRLIPSVPNTFDESWIGCWYRELPLSSIEQLDLLTRKVRNLLRRGLKLPTGLQILIVQSRHEVVVDRRSAFMIADGLRQNHIELLMLDSHWHLPILPREREPREDAIKDWVYSRILDFLQRQNLPPARV